MKSRQAPLMFIQTWGTLSALSAVCRQQMAEAGVNGVVTADVVHNLSNDTVLTTAWVDGECGLTLAQNL